MSRIIVRACAALVLSVLLVASLAAFAHEEIESGSYVFEIGWTNEPVIVGQPNGLELVVAPKDDHENGVSGVESALKFTVEYGGVSRSYDLTPQEGEPGRYTAGFIPTREGQYTFRFTGSIEGESVDLTFEPEEVVSAGNLAFPEEQPSAAALAAQIAEAQAQASTAQTLAIVGLVVGVIGAGVGVFGLMRKK